MKAFGIWLGTETPEEREDCLNSAIKFLGEFDQKKSWGDISLGIIKAAAGRSLGGASGKPVLHAVRPAPHQMRDFAPDDPLT